MRRVAAELGPGAMSLDRHVPGKDELLLLMRDAVFAEFRCRRGASGLAGRAGAHGAGPVAALPTPSLARADDSLTRPYAGPNQMPYSEWNLRALSGLGLDERPCSISTCRCQLRARLGGQPRGREPRGGRYRLTGDQWLEQRETATRSVFGSGAFPVSERVFAARDLRLDLDRLFEFGLARLLDGIERFAAGTGGRVAEVRPAAPRPGAPDPA